MDEHGRTHGEQKSAPDSAGAEHLGREGAVGPRPDGVSSGAHPPTSAGGPSMMVMEALVAVLILLFGAVIVYDSVRIGYRWAEDGPESGYFPFYIGVIICASSIIILYQALFGSLRSKALFVEWTQLKDVLLVLIPAALYVFAIQVIGIYVASAIYIGLFMVLMGKYSVIKGLATGIGVAAVFFLLFEVWFKLPLYKGWFDPLAFMGY